MRAMREGGPEGVTGGGDGWLASPRSIASGRKKLLSGEVNLAPELDQKVLDGRLPKHVACQEDQADDHHHRHEGAHGRSAGVDIQGRRGFAAASRT
jgi:hypothetical protein